ncbi:MAG TPA: ProQ/FINO family protein [Ramlibacter sp.]|nr:ProQ/FINO family protein [Ramlibacter sp.]
MTETAPQSTAAPLEAHPPAAPAHAPAEGAARRPAPGRRPRKSAPPGAAAPGGAGLRPAHQVLERLFQLYPKMFGARFLPLKLGVFQDILALHPDEFKKEDLKTALGLHARSTRYLEAVASGEKRHDLNAVPVDDVAPEHVHHAIMEVFRRRQARSKEDLRPWLRTRLVKAIEASGLTREQYGERVPTSDPLAQAALDEAFAELGEQVAKAEALRRAYAASGRSVEAFAEMYGLEPAAVRAVLGPVTLA